MEFHEHLEKELNDIKFDVIEEMRGIGEINKTISKLMDWATSGDTSNFSDAVDLSIKHALIKKTGASREDMIKMLTKINTAYKESGPEAVKRFLPEYAELLGIQLSI